MEYVSRTLSLFRPRHFRSRNPHYIPPSVYFHDFLHTSIISFNSLLHYFIQGIFGISSTTLTVVFPYFPSFVRFSLFLARHFYYFFQSFQCIVQGSSVHVTFALAPKKLSLLFRSTHKHPFVLFPYFVYNTFTDLTNPPLLLFKTLSLFCKALSLFRENIFVISLTRRFRSRHFRYRVRNTFVLSSRTLLLLRHTIRTWASFRLTTFYHQTRMSICQIYFRYFAQDPVGASLETLRLFPLKRFRFPLKRFRYFVWDTFVISSETL